LELIDAGGSGRGYERGGKLAAEEKWTSEIVGREETEGKEGTEVSDASHRTDEGEEHGRGKGMVEVVGNEFKKGEKGGRRKKKSREGEGTREGGVKSRELTRPWGKEFFQGTQ